VDLAELDASMSAMAEALNRPADLGQALGRIAAAAQDTVPGADYASITVRHPDGTLETVAGTAQLVYEADELQYSLQEGPCYDAVTADEQTYSRDLQHDRHWPRFGPRVAALGLLSQMGIRLSRAGQTVSGLNLYSLSRDAFDPSDPLPRLFASHASVALGYATKLQSLQGALASRETIGKAIGIVMERYDISSERAFEFLIRISQNTNVKLRDVAADVVGLTLKA
jgi:ANTAR domain-containing protein/GAF domain-containing protein